MDWEFIEAVFPELTPETPETPNRRFWIPGSVQMDAERLFSWS